MEQKSVLAKIETLRNLPSLPHVLVELLRVCEQEETTFDDLSRIIETDPSLSAKVMSLVNSAYYSLPHKAASLAQAVTLLGIDTVVNISLSSSVYHAFEGARDDSGFNMGLFWWHSLVCANISKQIAKKISYSLPEEAFLVGLLHDIGRLILSTNFQKEYASLLRSVKGTDYARGEHAVFGIDHAEVGAWMTRRWNLKPSMSDALLYHHESPDKVSDSDTIVKILYVANIMSEPMQGPEDSALKIARDLLELDPDELETILAAARADAEKAAEALQIDMQAIEEFRSGLTCAGYEEKKEELAEKVMDITILHGTVQNLLRAWNEEEIFRVAKGGLKILFDLEGAIFFVFDRKKKVLAGKCGIGTATDDQVTRIKVPLKHKGSTLAAAMKTRGPVDSFDFLKGALPGPLDKELIRLCGTEGILCLPMIARREFSGAIVLGTSMDHVKLILEHIDLLNLFAGHVAVALQADGLTRRLTSVSRLKSAIVDNSPLMILSVNLQGEIVHMNPKAQESFASLMDGPVNFLDLLKTTSSTVSRSVARILEDKETDIPPFKHAVSSGNVVWLSGKGLPLRKEEFEDKTFLILLEDITQRRALERKNREYAVRLEEKVKIREDALKKAQARLIQSERLAAAGALARKVAHEANNPLAIIKNYLKILQLKDRETEGHAEAEDELAIITEEIDRVGSIVRKLTDFSRSDVLTPEPVDINAVLSDLIKIYHESLLIEFDITVDVRKEPSSLTIVTDRNKIKQVFINLIKNAVEAMPGGGMLSIETRWVPEKDIDERLRQNGAGGVRYAEIIVRDQGKGIPDKLKSSLFEPFVSSKGEGHSGLGLSISYSIIKELHGDISCETREGGGTSFRVLLPDLKDL